MDEQAAQQHEGSPELFMFLASTVHDMKNSISVLSGTLENLLAAHQSSAAPEYGQMAQMLYQTKRLNDNLIQLLALYKDVGKPGYPFDPAPRSVRELVELVAGQAHMLLHSRGIAFDVDYPKDAIWTLDEDLVIGVLVHAINNAVRYTRDRIRLSIAVDGEYLELRVEDNGAGFPASMLECGASAKAAINFLSNSSGLGLYFSSEVAKMHKHRQRSGSIALENGGALGGGCFILRLP
ncbi:signal transduction histidine kinase [Duganella sp. 1224]|uniref:sensor histidine kinase n=1 Tax=Duganella sp. 1224 TaxID=2587052 RepID=UPI0015C7C007|nr:HAMP domain-containing sensor histidine kinase [Duganella sp. 1224]NYE63439.1 signal transduction histidine kinase [Duganella sp. 1224]